MLLSVTLAGRLLQEKGSEKTDLVPLVADLCFGIVTLEMAGLPGFVSFLEQAGSL